MAPVPISASLSSNAHAPPALSPRPYWSSRHSRKAPSRSSPIMIYNNAVYYPNGRLREAGKSPASLPSSAISHIFYAFAKVDADGSVKLSDPVADSEMPVDGHRGGIRAACALKSTNDRLKVILSIGGPSRQASQAFYAAAKDKERRQRCAQTARELVDFFELDGIDIDWEDLYDPYYCNSYLQLLAEMRAQLPKQQYLLTSALGASEWGLKHIDLKAACHYLDFVNVITFDFSGPWSPVAGHASQVYPPAEVTDSNIHCTTVLSALRYYLKQSGVPPQKINIGIPCFGRSFLGAKKAGDAYSGRGGVDGVFAYHDLPRPNSIDDFDNEAKACYSFGGDGGFVSYDNPTSVAIKAGLVKEHGLAGLFFWDAPSDHQGYRSIVMAGYLTLSPGSSCK